MSKLDLTEQHARERAGFAAQVPIPISRDDHPRPCGSPHAVRPRIRNRWRDRHQRARVHLFCGRLRVRVRVSVMRTRARHVGCSAAAFVAVAFTAAIAIPPASVQAADAQAQIDSFAFAPQRLTPDATSGKTLRSSARRGTKGWIALHRWMVRSFMSKLIKSCS
jgi:hypothetical protein